jgi:Ser/Thr protein kinase RdoA (MazF antagonist)
VNDQNFQKRINFQGDLKILLSNVAKDYNLGEFLSYNINLIGYEDLNVVLQSSKGKYFVKIFSSFRKINDCHRFLNIVNTVIGAGVNHPKLFSASNGQLYEFESDGKITRLCVMEYIDGDSFYGLKKNPSTNEILEITDMAAKINLIDYKPSYIYDSWAIPNILKEYEITKNYLDIVDKALLDPLIVEAKKIDFKVLPHSFVHGDLIKTNILLNKNGKIFVVDFSVANSYPRIQELAVLFVNMFFNEKDLNNYKNIYDLVLDRYQKTISLTEKEIEVLPLYTKLSHAMHIIGSSQEKGLRGNVSEENNYWLHLGRTGLKYMNDSW